MHAERADVRLWALPRSPNYQITWLKIEVGLIDILQVNMGSDHSHSRNLDENEGPPPQNAPTHVIDCSEPWFTHILEGRKPVEGRKASEKRGKVAVGDVVVFRDPADQMKTFLARVTAVTRYEGPGALRKYLEGETLARALPGVESFEAGEKVYLAFGWTHEEIDKNGMLGIQIQVIPRDGAQ
jgi:ASC-1-like (ASCH) protein